MVENTPLPPSLPSVRRKKVTAAFDGGRITSDGGGLLVSAITDDRGDRARRYLCADLGQGNDMHTVLAVGVMTAAPTPHPGQIAPKMVALS